MTKLEQAARQALEALEELFHSNSTKVAVEKYNTAHNALREALGYCVDEGCPHRGTTHTCVNPLAEQAEHKPVAWWNGKETVWFEHELITDGPVGECKTPLYAAPVRTKDLTDDEIEEIIDREFSQNDWHFHFARSVIAAYKEKNK